LFKHGALNLQQIVTASDGARRLVCRRGDSERIPPESDATHNESQNDDDGWHNDGELGRHRAAISAAHGVH
jgi:hypothetical protein